MPIQFRTYSDKTRLGEDYRKLRDFLIDLDDCNYSFGRWDWMVTHSMLEEKGLSKIGIWEDSGKIVALATYDTRMDGKCFFARQKGYDHLLCGMIAHAEENLAGEGPARLAIRDGDEAFQAAADRMGFVPTQENDGDAVFPIDGREIRYTLPEGFAITSMRDSPDYYKYGEVLWKGFNHEQNGEGPFAPTAQDLQSLRNLFDRPNCNASIKIAVVAPDGNFVSYCGMWHDPACRSAIVEPVATDPAYRKMGLGRAAVLEGVRRCGELGAERAFVGSSQQFYYQIGFRPFATSSFWAKR